MNISNTESKDEVMAISAASVIFVDAYPLLSRNKKKEKSLKRVDVVTKYTEIEPK